MSGKQSPRRRVGKRAQGGMKQKRNQPPHAGSRSSRAPAQTTTTRGSAKTSEQSSQRLLLAITRVQSLVIDEAQPAEVFGLLLQELLTLTDSEYGFIGEVDRTPEGQPFLRTHAITDIAWNAETKVLMAEQAPTLVFRNLKTLFGHVMTSGKPVITNDPSNDPRAGGLPPGHPPMPAFLGLPFYRGERMTGMVGVANRPGGYDEALVAYLEPFLSTCAQLLEGYRQRQLRTEAEQALREAHLAVESSMEGISRLDETGHYVFVNARYAGLLGYRPEELIGQSWEMTVHPDDRGPVLAVFKQMLAVGRAEAEIRGVKKDGGLLYTHVVLVKPDGPDGTMPGYFCFVRDITQRKRADALQRAEKQALELVAKGARLNEVLTFICDRIESHTSPMLCSVMLVTEDRAHLSLAAGPSLPEAYNQAVATIPIGPTIGSCGSAAYFKKPSVVSDIATDPLWKDYASLAAAYGLKACWSYPIISATGEVLGTFAAYYRELRSPQPTDLTIVEWASHIAALAIEHVKVTEALRESEARFQAFMQHNPAFTFIKDGDGRHLFVNARFEQLFRMSSTEAISKTVFDFLPNDIATRMHGADQTVIDSGQPMECEETISTVGDLTTHWLTIKFPLETKQGRLLGGIAIDITERKRFEQASQEQQDRLQLAMDIAGIAIWDWNIVTNQVTWSDNCEQIKRLPAGSFDGTFEAYQRLVHPEDLPRFLAEIDGALNGQTPYHTEHRIVPPTGEVQWVEGNGVVYRDDLGRPVRMVGTVWNITERKRAEQTLRLNEERYARATAVGRVGVWELDVRTGTYYGDRNLKAMFGYQDDELSADPFAWLSLVHPDDQATAMTHWQRIVGREIDDYHYELRMIKKDGTVIWTDVRGQAIRDADGQVTQLIGATADVTDRKMIVEALRESEERYRTVVTAMAEGIVIQGQDGRISSCNASACRILGLTEAQILGRDSYDPQWKAIHEDGSTFPGETHPAMETLRTGRALENVIMGAHRPDGVVVWISINTQPILGTHSEIPVGVVSSFRDITKRKQAEEHLQRTQFSMDQAVDAVYWIDHQACILYTNEAASRMLGYTADEFRRMTVHDLNPEFPAEVWPGFWDETREKKVISLETVHLTKDGRRIPIDIRVSFLAYGGQEFHCAFVRDISHRKRVEEQAHRSLALLQTVLHTVPIRVFWKDRTSRYLGCNQQFALDAGYADAEAIIGKTDDELVWRQQAALYRADDREVMESGCAKLDFDEPGTRGDGMQVWLRTSKVPLRNEQGQVIGVLGVYEDVTERKRLDDALRASQERFELAAKASNDGLWDWDILTGLQYWSDRHFELLGHRPGDFSPTYDQWISLLHLDDVDHIHQATQHHLKTREPYDVEVRVRMTDGSYRWFRDRGQAVWDATGRPVRMVGSICDVTERKMAQDELERHVAERTLALRQSEQRYASLVNSTEGIILEVDETYRITFISQHAERILGYPVRQWLDDPLFWITHLHPDDQSWAPVYYRDQVKQGLNHEFEYRMIASDGRKVWIRDSVSVVCDDQGRRKLYRLMLDVTKQKEMLERLQLTQYAIDHASDQIFVVGPDGAFRDVNESACRRLGYTKAELCAMSVMDIDPGFSEGLWGECWARLLQMGQLRLETRHCSKSGEIYPVEVVANYLNHNGQELDYAIVRDITERRQAEAAIRDSELRYKLLTEATFDGIAIHDEGILLEVNAGLERMFGYEAGELIGRSMWELIAEESRGVVLANMHAGTNGPYEAMGRRKDGSTFPGELVVRPYRYRGKDVRLVAGRDITERKHLERERRRHTEELERQVCERTAEIAKLESQRAQSERLAAMGRLAAGVAHEINNPIAGIKNAFALVKQAIDPAHPEYQFVGMVDREIERVSSIVHNMYQLYGRESGKVEAVDLRTMVRDIEALFEKQLLQRQLTLVVEMEPGLDCLDVPRSDLLQVLLNLLNNAIDCSYETTEIRLLFGVEGECVRVVVTDQGAGIAPEVLPHIFDPFFTTKTEGEQKGMGLGLAISQSLVAAMGGKIDVQTQLGQGSTFSVLIPRHRAAASLPRHTATIKEVISYGC